jgi:hypothetical protein
MAFTYKGNLPLVSATKFNVSNAAAIAAGTADYGTYTNAGNGDWILGSDLKKVGRAILVVINSATLANTVTNLKVALLMGDDANGTNGAEVTGSTTVIATPAGDSAYTAVINLNAVTITDAKYYSLGLAVSGANNTNTLIADAVGLVLDPQFAS